MPTLNMQKGQKVDLSKTVAPGITNYKVGCGWDTKAAGNVSADYDLDVAVLLLENDKLVGSNNTVYFGNLSSENGAVVLSGDNRTGAGEGDDESVLVDLAKVPVTVNRLVFAINIYQAQEKGQNFGQVKNSYIRLLADGDDSKEILRYDLGEEFSTATNIEVGSLYRMGSEWKFEASGRGFEGSLQSIVDTYA